MGIPCGEIECRFLARGFAGTFLAAAAVIPAFPARGIFDAYIANIVDNSLINYYHIIISRYSYGKPMLAGNAAGREGLI